MSTFLIKQNKRSQKVGKKMTRETQWEKAWVKTRLCTSEKAGLIKLKQTFRSFYPEQIM